MAFHTKKSSSVKATLSEWTQHVMRGTMKESNFGEAELAHAYGATASFTLKPSNGFIPNVMPFFSIRKLRLVYNELCSDEDFEFKDFEHFKRHVLSSVAPQLELNKWQAIAARR